MVTVKNQTSKEIDIKKITALFNLVVHEKRVKKKVNLYLVDNEAIKELNRKFFKKNKPTNVISFPEEGDKKTLGEIIVSVDYCEKEQEETGLDREELIVFYFIHGLLHLLGYEHIHGGKEEKIMRKEELRLFRKCFPDIELEDE
ncbi:MAG: rRNA maturation RNase YbeY [Proteobacteria bacterium]|nr:rRNA maturation RNase YbeY [Pseudomonadota bacterium]